MSWCRCDELANRVYRTRDYPKVSARSAHNAVFDFLSPVRRFDQPQGGGGIGEHCSSPERSEVELRSPACLRLIEGTPQER